MTNERREAQRQGGIAKRANLISVSDTLKRREAWKYANLKSHLEKTERKFEFEYAVGPFIFDLALLDSRVLVEFDGPYHKNLRQKNKDLIKTKAGEDLGFAVIRRNLDQEAVMSPSILSGL